MLITELSVTFPIFLLTRGATVPRNATFSATEVVALVPTVETAVTPVLLARSMNVVAGAELDIIATLESREPGNVRC